MSKKSMAMWSIIMVVVFSVTVVVYPLIFNPADQATPDAAPVNMPVEAPSAQ